PYDPEETAALPHSPAQPPAGHHPGEPPAGHHPGEPVRSWASWTAPSSEGHYETPAPPQSPIPNQGNGGGPGPAAEHGAPAGPAGKPGCTTSGAYGSALVTAGNPGYATSGAYGSSPGTADGNRH